MRKLTAPLLLAGFAVPFALHAQTPAAPAAPAPVAEPTPEHSFATKISLYSEYEYRGISQTSEKPALQLNLDYTHSSGFYAGLFLTNIEWLKDTAETLGGHTRGGSELDLFFGYRKEVFAEATLDVGYLRYQYPRSDDFYLNPKIHTDEVYAGLTWKYFNVKYSYAFSDTFGVPNSEGSSFVEANIAFPLTDKFMLTGHVGHQFFRNNDPLGYTVYKLGVTFDAGDGWTLGGYYKDTDAQSDLYTYHGTDWSKGRLVGFVSKSFSL